MTAQSEDSDRLKTVLLHIAAIVVTAAIAILALWVLGYPDAMIPMGLISLYAMALFGMVGWYNPIKWPPK